MSEGIIGNLLSDQIEVFAVCLADAIERTGAKGFSLSRIDASGECRPFLIIVLRTFGNDYFGYVNRCPHDSAWLNIGSGEFFSPDRSFLRCGRHGARFEIDTGVCIDGPCNGQALEPVALTVIDGDVCLRGVKLLADDRRADLFEDSGETMDVMIHPD
ncbi:Rieske 2Fe-2S domain-containing protein [Bradyrhizobium septentrionale]|uniref:Rieske 2Fe-2S domain-containing protein n=1 Tax=Bradyrhizobium septentrionale TaxID=1404411 RepID=A0A973VVZ6_9BRAD|nr:Rieske 2Fe-2S domain-containing protein [Bradyrhizobium septentrionale]UGY20289.1 Rieske 2Fe-2S domain-containing protein [Bradyrhizobium septentrionale]UGY29121.1 Rieske 2Fe-2S domain-containing protein [Bradyrhizobium septentrionale]